MKISQEHKNSRSEYYPNADSPSSLREEDMLVCASPSSLRKEYKLVSANELQSLQPLRSFLTDAFGCFLLGRALRKSFEWSIPQQDKERCDLRYYNEEPLPEHSERADDDFRKDDFESRETADWVNDSTRVHSCKWMSLLTKSILR